MAKSGHHKAMVHGQMVSECVQTNMDGSEDVGEHMGVVWRPCGVLKW